MKPPNQSELFSAVDATWAPLAIHACEGWLIREGAGGGQRVSSATLLPGAENASIGSAEKMMVSIGQNPLFMIRKSDLVLDAGLCALRYKIVDPVTILTAPTGALMGRLPGNTYNVDRLETPGTDAINIWRKGGFDKNRLAVMTRVKGPKVVLSAGKMGVAFAATHGDIAMVHAVEVSKKHRRKGVANALMHEASKWAFDRNCNWMSVLTVRDNLPARVLYESLGMKEAAAYHYRLNVSE